MGRTITGMALCGSYCHMHGPLLALLSHAWPFVGLTVTCLALCGSYCHMHGPLWVLLSHAWPFVGLTVTCLALCGSYCHMPGPLRVLLSHAWPTWLGGEQTTTTNPIFTWLYFKWNNRDKVYIFFCSPNKYNIE